jgi:hypothetical protein
MAPAQKLGRRPLPPWRMPGRSVGCLDQSEGIDYDGGELGTAVMQHALALAVRRRASAADLVVTLSRSREFKHRFGIDLSVPAGLPRPRSSTGTGPAPRPALMGYPR